MGANDTNDAVHPDDAHDAEASRLIDTPLSAQGSPVVFRTYPDIGRGLDERISAP